MVGLAAFQRDGLPLLVDLLLVLSCQLGVHALLLPDVALLQVTLKLHDILHAFLHIFIVTLL